MMQAHAFKTAAPVRTACLGLVQLGEPDKFFLDGYPNEEGYSARTRLTVLIVCACAPWVALAAALIVRA